jgi:hypothetical protein
MTLRGGAFRFLVLILLLPRNPPERNGKNGKNGRIRFVQFIGCSLAQCATCGGWRLLQESAFFPLTMRRLCSKLTQVRMEMTERREEKAECRKLKAEMGSDVSVVDGRARLCRAETRFPGKRSRLDSVSPCLSQHSAADCNGQHICVLLCLILRIAPALEVGQYGTVEFKKCDYSPPILFNSIKLKTKAN